MQASAIRQSFFDFFQSKQHTILPSVSLLPQSPGLLFTNAGMNAFVPYFLGVMKAPYAPPRVADTQKCIRAGGKHNDLEDVGYDTYHHTFFEMLGNWSFGDYFKEEAIAWAWELIVDVWGIPPHRLYATVYKPGKGDPGVFDKEAHKLWSQFFAQKGLDPSIHVVGGNVKDNFWMMGETGPCGPCSELHVDLTPEGHTQGKLVNAGSDQCIEIRNLVFIQYNAEKDGSFRDLPACHVDTGMGLERVVALHQCTKGFSDFSQKTSNYATDLFAPLFSALEQLSGKTYHDRYPEDGAGKDSLSDSLKESIAFRVIADHIRTLSFSIADGILPGNSGRNYVLRRILRRAVRYGRTLGFDSRKLFLSQLVPPLIETMGEVFPELSEQKSTIIEILDMEEKSFNATLDRGLARLEEYVGDTPKTLDGALAFQLYDTYGFPLDLTELLCAERGISVDIEGFEKNMQAQRDMARRAQTRELIAAADIATEATTQFVGYEQDSCKASILEIHEQPDSLYIITDKTPFFVEMGGQLGDTGTLIHEEESFEVSSVRQLGDSIAHVVDISANLVVGDAVELCIDASRRRPIEAHHTATHLLHCAIHQEVASSAHQQGSLVSRKRLRFDFNAKALDKQKLGAIEKQVNCWIEEASEVSTCELAFSEVKGRKDIEQFFGDKYGESVRVVQIGGQAGELNGYSMELCGGTHVRNTQEIGLFKIKSEGAVAAGIRRIEAVCGQEALDWMGREVEKYSKQEKSCVSKLLEIQRQLEVFGVSPENIPQFPHIMEALGAGSGNYSSMNDTFTGYIAHVKGLENRLLTQQKLLKKYHVQQSAKDASRRLEKLVKLPQHCVKYMEGDAGLLTELLNGLKARQFNYSAFFILDDGEKLHLGAYCGQGALDDGWQAGKLIAKLAPLADGKGGGRPENARGGAPSRDKAGAVYAEAKKVLQME